MEITVTFSGALKKRVGKTSDAFLLSRDPAQASEQIKILLKDRYAIEPPYIVMVNRRSLAGMIKKSENLAPQDIVRIVPYAGGG